VFVIFQETRRRRRGAATAPHGKRRKFPGARAMACSWALRQTCRTPATLVSLDLQFKVLGLPEALHFCGRNGARAELLPENPELPAWKCRSWVKTLKFI